jgi:hypothetical protein
MAPDTLEITLEAPTRYTKHNCIESRKLLSPEIK